MRELLCLLLGRRGIRTGSRALPRLHSKAVNTLISIRWNELQIEHSTVCFPALQGRNETTLHHLKCVANQGFGDW